MYYIQCHVSHQGCSWAGLHVHVGIYDNVIQLSLHVHDNVLTCNIIHVHVCLKPTTLALKLNKTSVNMATVTGLWNIMCYALMISSKCPMCMCTYMYVTMTCIHVYMSTCTCIIMDMYCTCIILLNKAMNHNSLFCVCTCVHV